MWKLSKLEPNVPTTSRFGRYVYGEVPHKDIFTSNPVLQKKRTRKPNSKYFD